MFELPQSRAPDHGPLIASMESRVNQLDQMLQTLQRQTERARQTLAGMDATRLLAQVGRSPRSEVEFRSQLGEDRYAWDLLGRPLSGFYIEVGAFDGLSCSVTAALEAMGWTGLLVEAIPERAAACRVNRPHSRVVHAALSSRGSVGETEFAVVDDPHGGMLSFIPSVTDPRHAGQVSSLRYGVRTVRVPLTTMDALLADHAGPIDLAVIDVEGAEPALLDGFSLARHRPRLMLIEDNTMGANPRLDAAMAPHPYAQVAWVECSRVYVRTDEKAMLDRAANLL